MHLSSIVVIIPALNEQDSLPLVLRDLPAVQRVFVVDNGSTDGTASVAANHGATVVRESIRGYGRACLAGLSAIESEIEAGMKPPEVVVFLDADYSDYPEELELLVEPIQQQGYDLVIGSRALGDRDRGAMPPQAVWGNWLACRLMRWLWGARFTDLGPFRAVRYSALRQLDMIDQDFGWTIEMQIKAVRQNLRYCELPVRYRKRIGSSKISGTISGTLRAGFKILYTIGRYGFAASAQGQTAMDPASGEVEAKFNPPPVGGTGLEEPIEQRQVP